MTYDFGLVITHLFHLDLQRFRSAADAESLTTVNVTFFKIELETSRFDRFELKQGNRAGTGHACSAGVALNFNQNPVLGSGR
jgi:hypothetical protein